MGALSQTTFSAMLKVMYPQMEVTNLAVRKNAFLGMVKKADDFEGKQMDIPVEYELPAGRSASLAAAITNITSSKSVAWTISQKESNGVVSIDALTMRSSRSKKGAFLEARRRELDNMFAKLGKDLAIHLFRDGWGSIGQVSATVAPSGTTVTLAVNQQALNFSIGTEFTAAAGATGSTPRDSGNSLTVTKVNYSADPDTASTLTTDAVAGISGFTTSDYIFVEGDNDLAGTTKALPTGLAGWIPLTAETSGTFLGADRTLHTTRLQGHRLDESAIGIEQNINRIAEEIAGEGGNADMAIVNHTKYSELCRGLGTKVEYVAGGTAEVGFRGVKVYTSVGVVEVFPDNACPSNRGYVLQKDTWTLHHLDGLPHFVEDDGLIATRGATTNDIQCRGRLWAELVCTAPGYNGVFSI